MEIDKTYDPRRVEPEIYSAWQEAKAFHADPAGRGNTYCIVIPPPNVTDRLHVGHALNNALQDILIRQKRMAGRNTLWMPGTDHASIATQTVVERRILAEEGKRRTDFQRDEFVARVQAWKDEYERQILTQLKAMGCSCDWQRTRFTMDEVCTRAVREAFFRLFADGLIYRGKRLVNWDPATQTVLADDEVEHETVAGHFWYLRYLLVEPVEIGGETITHVTVATTRPETMLGDTAVAMNPADPRAKHLVGKTVELPIVGRRIPIIADDLVVLPDPESEDEKARFSTGFLKVTPAHDPSDWEVGQRHDLDVVNVMAPDGTISDRHGWDDATAPEAQALLGMDRFEAREAIVQWFRKQDLLEDVREYAHEVGHSYRSQVPIEPYLSDQWFIAVKKPIPHLAEKFGDGLIDGTDVPANSLAGLALRPLLDGKLKFTPDRYANVYRAWLENLRDWPISRQLWWGHQIPIWKGSIDLLSLDPEESDETKPFFLPVKIEGVKCAAQTRKEDGERVAYLSVPPGHPDTEVALEEMGFTRDDDVLDTWFSSALWPISTMGWPEETELLETFYPSDVLCTAREIITLWVSRMVMFGQYFRGEPPFADVYIHAMIQDGEGRKMSKSLGNGIDPVDIIESHGADAMRFTLAYMTTQTQDVRMPVEEMTLPDGRQVNSSPKFDVGRNFCTKLWNASRFALMNLDAVPPWAEAAGQFDLSDAWILSRLNRTVRDVTEALGAYRFHEAAGALYRCMWNDLCDWYLEIAKVRLAAGQSAPKAVMAHALDVLLRLLHPIIPFITEQLWGELNSVAPIRGPHDTSAEPMLIRAAWPRAESAAINEHAEGRFATVRELVGGIREARSRHNVPPGKTVPITVAADGEQGQMIADNGTLIGSLARVEPVRVDPAARCGPADATVMAAGMQAFLHGVVDRQAEEAKLTKRQQTLAQGIEGAVRKLANAKFLENAPAEVVGREKQRLAAMRQELNAVEKALSQLQ